VTTNLGRARQRDILTPMEVKLEVRTGYVFVAFAGPISPPKIHQEERNAIDAALDAGLHLMLFDWSELEGFITSSNRRPFPNDQWTCGCGGIQSRLHDPDVPRQAAGARLANEDLAHRPMADI